MFRLINRIKSSLIFIANYAYRLTISGLVGMVFLLFSQSVFANSGFERIGQHQILSSIYEMKKINLDEDISDEVIAVGVGLSLWSVIDFDEEEGVYRPLMSVKSDSVLSGNPGFLDSGYRLSVGLLESGDDPKVVVGSNNGSLYICDAKSGKIEYTSYVSGRSTIEQVFIYDVNADGIKEIIVLTNTSISIFNRTISKVIAQLALSEVFGEVEIGNIDNDPQIEIIDHQGRIFEIQDRQIIQQSTLPNALNPTPFNSFRLTELELSDVDGDGIDEVIALYGRLGVVIYDAENSLVKWQFLEDFDDIDASLIGSKSELITGDVDGDDRPDIIFSESRQGTRSAKVRAFNGITGDALWQFDFVGHRAQSMLLADVNGDGQSELLLSSLEPVSGPDELMVFNYGLGDILWKSTEELGPVRAMAVSDIDKDGELDITYASPKKRASFDSIARRRSAADITHQWTSDPFWLEDTLASEGIGALAIADVDNDNQPDMVIGTDDLYMATVVAVDSITMENKFNTRLADGARVSALAIADVDLDGTLEIVAGIEGLTTAGIGSLIYILDAETGSIEWESETLILADKFFVKTESIRIDNLDDDLQAETVISAEKIIVIDGLTHEITTSSNEDYLGIALISVDQSDTLSIIAGHTDGRVSVLDTTNLNELSSSLSCKGPVNAISENTLLSASVGSVLMTCGKQIGVLDIINDDFLSMTAPLGVNVGNGNHLYHYMLSNGDSRIATSTSTGIQLLGPVTNLLPFVLTERVDTPVPYFVFHWRGTYQLDITGAYGDHDEDLVSLNIADVDIDGTLLALTDSQSIDPQFTFTPAPLSGPQYISFVASDAAGESNVGSFAVSLQNTAPRIMDRNFSLEAGNEVMVPFGGDDQDDDPLVYEVITGPTKGTIESLVDNEAFVYRANENSNGEDYIEVIASDTMDQSSVARITFSISEMPVTPDEPSTGSKPSSGGGSFGLEMFLMLLMIVSKRAWIYFISYRK